MLAVSNPERALQITIVNAIGPMLYPWTFMTHFPAGRSSGGGMKGRIRGANLKRAGLKAGVPDLMFVHHGQIYFMELKAKTKVSGDQTKCHADLRAAGALVETVRSLDEALACLHLWRIPIRIKDAA